jgi:hypothetical protein
MYTFANIPKTLQNLRMTVSDTTPLSNIHYTTLAAT